MDEAARPTQDIYAATNLLFHQRHSLPADILRSLQSTYFCASAAQYGEPYEGGWLDDQEEYESHDTAECEAENCETTEPIAGTALADAV